TTLARVLDRKGDNAGAKANLKEALSIWSSRFSNQDPGIGETLNALFDVLFQEGNRAEAEELFQQVLTPAALGKQPNIGVLRACGNYHARTEQWSRAVEDFSMIVQSNPANHEAYHALSALFIQTSDLAAY